MSESTIHHYRAGEPHTGLELYVNDEGELVLYCSKDDAAWTLPSATPAPRPPDDRARGGHGAAGRRGSGGLRFEPGADGARSPVSMLDNLRSAGIVGDGSA